MTIRRTLVGQPVEKPSGQQIRKKINASKTIKGFKMRPGYVYTVVRAISARINQNYDGWPSDELKLSYHTFLGKPVFVNHTNEDPNTARGVVVAARYLENGNDKYVECVQEIDAQRYPKVAQEIITGGLDSVSMGAEAGFTICSYCNNRAVDEYDLCDHVKYHKGSTLRKFNRRTGKTEDVLVYESCHKLSFFELSYVFDPADETAVASKVLVAGKKTAADHAYLHELGPDGIPTWLDDPLKRSNAQALRDLGKEPEYASFLADHAYNKLMDAQMSGDDDAAEVWSGRRYQTEDYEKSLNREASYKAAGATEDYLAWKEKVESGEITPEREFGPARGGGPSRAQQRWLDQTKRRLGFEQAVLKAAGFKTAKCHYCDLDAEEGFNSCSSHRAMEQNKFTKGGALDCPPGADCGRDDPNDETNFDPASATTTDTDTSASDSTTSNATAVGAGTSDVSDLGLNPGAAGFASAIKDMYPDLEIGGRREDPYPDHPSGNAADYMVGVGDPRGDKIKDMALASGADYVLWKQQQWNADGSVSPMNDRGDPTQNHMDHPHVMWGAESTGGSQSGPNPAAQPKAAAMKMSFEARVLQAAGYEDLDEFPAALQGYQHHRDNNYGGVDSWDSMQHYVDQANNTHGGFGGATEDKLWNYVKNRMNMPGFGPYGRDTQHPQGPYPNDIPSEKYQVPSSMSPQQRLNSFEEAVLRTAGMLRLAQGDGDENDDDDDEENTRSNGQDNPPNTPRSDHPEPGNTGTVTPDADAPAAGAPGAPADAPAGAPAAPVGVGGAALESWQLPGGTNPTDPHGLAMPLSQGQVGVYSPTLQHNVTTEDVSSQANQDAIGAWNSANPTNVFDPNAKYDTSTMEKGVQHLFTMPGPEGAGAPPPAAGAPPPAASTTGPTTPGEASDVISQVGLDTPQAPAPPGPTPPAAPITPTSSFEKRVLRVAWGEIQAPTEVDTLRGEGSATGDDTEDFHHYVESPDDLKGPDTSEAAQLDREQAMGGDEPPMGEEPPPQQPQQQYMTLQIPIPLQQEPPPPQLPTMPQPVQTATPLQGPVPGQQPGGGALPPAAGGIPPQPQQPPQQMAASFTARTATADELAYFERYFGHRIANWRDAIVANRPMTPEEGADYRRARGKFLVSSTLEKVASVSTTSRTSEKGSANMARSTLAERGKVASQGRRRHYAEGPLVDTGDLSRNDQGEQEDAFITPTPPPESTPLPDDDTHNISNTENNLVAKVQRGRQQLLRDAQALAALQQQKLAWDDDSDYFAPKDKYQRDRGRYNPSADEFDSDDEYDAFQRNRVAGVDGDADKVVNPTLPQPSANALKGDHFEPVEENPTPTRTTSAVNDRSLQIFQAFDQWLAKATGKGSRDHDEATIKRGAAEFAKRAKFNPQEMFPALGIVLREARKNDTRKAAAMRKRSDQGNQSLNVAAPDERIDVEAPQANVTNPKAQSSQFDANDFDNNSSKSKAKPDTSTDSQFWYPGGGNKGTKRRKPTGAQEKTAGALLGMRCAEAMIAAGLEPNDRERRYQLASEFQEMSRGAILDRTALAERFVGVRQADHQHYQQQVASGKSRGAARSPIPPGLSQGVQARTAATHRSAANDPSNDSLLFG